MPNKIFSVVICAYTEKRLEQLIRAVASVQGQTLPALEIIVVIDHNRALLEQASYLLSGVTLVENLGSRGLSAARNTGVGLVNGEIVAFIDDDAEAQQDWLEQLNKGYSNPAILGVGGAIEPNWLEGRPEWFPPEFDWVVGCTYLGMPSQKAEVRNLIGCNMSFRRVVFDLVGGFRTGVGRIGSLPMGCEETEFCIRLQKLQPNTQILYLPQALVRHNVTPERGTWHYFRARCRAEGLSKALIAQMVGATASLATERRYVLKTLPKGIFREMLAPIIKGDTGGLARALAIATGLIYTAFGYIQGKFTTDVTPLQIVPSIVPAVIA